MRIAYFDCFSGASGDMILGALLDAGLPMQELADELRKLGIEEFELTTGRTTQSGIAGTKASVRLLGSASHSHRHLSHIISLIEKSTLTSRVKEQASTIFQRLGRAEARVHGVNVEDIHFHEVGAVDAIVDIVGAVAGLELLGVSRVYSSSLPLGSGFVQCAHGTLPVPAPATMELVREANAPVRDVDVQAELLTPTGAAIITTLSEFRRPEMTIGSVGYGYGDRKLPWPNAVRLWIGEATDTEAGEEADQMVLLETNIDDMNPEVFGYLMSRLFEQGAADVYFTPIFMKKNRPATMVSVLTNPGKAGALCNLLMEETTTLGIRHTVVGRHKTRREEIPVETSLGTIRVKVKRRGDTVLGVSPEYEDCATIARARNLPLQSVYAIVHAEALRLLV